MLDKVVNLGNKNHNPFKSVVQKLDFFMETNKLTPYTLLKRIGAPTADGLDIESFGEFLKDKVEKTRGIE